MVPPFGHCSGGLPSTPPSARAWPCGVWPGSGEAWSIHGDASRCACVSSGGASPRRQPQSFLCSSQDFLMRSDRVQDAELVAEPSGDVSRLLDAAFGFLVWAGHLVLIYVANAVTCALGLTSGNP